MCVLLHIGYIIMVIKLKKLTCIDGPWKLLHSGQGPQNRKGWEPQVAYIYFFFLFLFFCTVFQKADYYFTLY